MIYQIHPDHGKHIAYSPQEAQANIANGWKSVTENEFYADVAETEIVDVSRETLETAYEEKFGKKPHHRMNDETIKAALDGDNE